MEFQTSFVSLTSDLSIMISAASRDQAKHMMSLRENIAPALKAVGFNYKYDVSLPIKDMYSLVEQVWRRVFVRLYFF